MDANHLPYLSGWERMQLRALVRLAKDYCGDGTPRPIRLEVRDMLLFIKAAEYFFSKTDNGHLPD